jgi:CBS-domain-containing membrane protein
MDDIIDLELEKIEAILRKIDSDPRRRRDKSDRKKIMGKDIKRLRWVAGQVSV